MSDKRMIELLEANNEKLVVRIKKELAQELSQSIEQTVDDKGVIWVDLLRQDIKASAEGLRGEMRQMKDELRTEMHTIKNEIVNGVQDVIDNGLLPQIDRLDRRVTRLEKRFGV